MTEYFIDTGFLIALEAADDQHHGAAIVAWRDIRKRRVTFVTTTYVFDEVVTFFNSRGHHAKAVATGEILLTSRIVTLMHVDEPIFSEAWREFAHQSDKRYSLTDCVSFAVMKRRRIKTALAFDKHFTQAGFERLP
ncbi:MAG: PIN domain-containing protein [Betaproteobacteria bacterium]|nr:PIN domain-containing protein [Betaproteobacteria bacterium]